MQAENLTLHTVLPHTYLHRLLAFQWQLRLQNLEWIIILDNFAFIPIGPARLNSPHCEFSWGVTVTPLSAASTDTMVLSCACTLVSCASNCATRPLPPAPLPPTFLALPAYLKAPLPQQFFAMWPCLPHLKHFRVSFCFLP